MFLSTTLLYPLELALLCVGTGLLVDRASGGFLPLALLPATGLAGLIAVTQLSTYAYPLAPATPYVAGAVAVVGFVVGRSRARDILRAARERPWLLLLPAGAYVIALAPVLASGRAGFSSYMALADSAVHLAGADYLLHHGQHYAHLDLRNSYGQVINDYYNSNYPSGADTAFGASAMLLGLPLIWAFQPFTAFVLASGSGAAWLLARASGLSRAVAAVAALTAVLGALVYAYELFGSIKEVTALGMILALGALVVIQERWVRSSVRGVIPFALIVAGGVSALGAAFGVWALLSALALLPAIVAALRDGGGARGRALVMLVVGVLVVLLAALPVWTSAGGSVQVAEGIASTTNPGNLVHALRAIQLFGIWLAGSYKLEPTGASSGLTHGLALLALAGALLGVWQLWRLRSLALLAWFGLMLLACLIVVESVSVWGGAKTLMLSSPAVVLLAWAGVGALIGLRPRAAGAGVLGGARTGPDGRRAGVGREAVPRLEPRSHEPLRRARAPELALRGAWPDPVHRLRRILAVRAEGPRRGGSRFRLSAARRRVSGGRPWTPGAARSAGALRAGCVPADHQQAGPAREQAAGRLPAGLAGVLLPGLATGSRCAGRGSPRHAAG